MSVHVPTKNSKGTPKGKQEKNEAHPGLQPAGLSTIGRMSVITTLVAWVGPRFVVVMSKLAVSPAVIGPFPAFDTVTSGRWELVIVQTAFWPAARVTEPSGAQSPLITVV